MPRDLNFKLIRFFRKFKNSPSTLDTREWQQRSDHDTVGALTMVVSFDFMATKFWILFHADKWSGFVDNEHNTCANFRGNEWNFPPKWCLRVSQPSQFELCMIEGELEVDKRHQEPSKHHFVERIYLLKSNCRGDFASTRKAFYIIFVVSKDFSSLRLLLFGYKFTPKWSESERISPAAINKTTWKFSTFSCA